jgi:hypothetical protein
VGLVFESARFGRTISLRHRRLHLREQVTTLDFVISLHGCWGLLRPQKPMDLSGKNLVLDERKDASNSGAAAGLRAKPGFPGLASRRLPDEFAMYRRGCKDRAWDQLIPGWPTWSL